MPAHESGRHLGACRQVVQKGKHPAAKVTSKHTNEGRAHSGFVQRPVAVCEGPKRAPQDGSVVAQQQPCCSMPKHRAMLCRAEHMIGDMCV